MNLIVGHLQTWFALFLVAILTVFSDKIVGRIRFALNRADLRSKYYEQLALGLSTFVFYSDLFYVRQVRLESHFEDLDAIRGQVNESFVTLKTNEYIYRSWVRRYWSNKGVKRFESVMLCVTNVYDAIIEFNEKGQEGQKTEMLGRRLAELKSNVDRWLSELDA